VDKIVSLVTKVIIMPVVIVEMWEGKTPEQKRKIVEGVTNVFREIGVKTDRLHVIIHDVPKTNWGTDGLQASNSVPS
jgi:4-oxalocrotonate tautomerase